MGQLREYCMNHRTFSFRTLLLEQNSRIQVIVTFPAVLELMKTGAIYIRQEHIFDDIYITSKLAA